LVAELRRHLVDPEISEGLRDAAAHRLAMLSRVRPGGRPLAPAADPSTWWGTREFTRSEAPLVPPDEPVAVSASLLTEIGVCPARWFMERGAAGQEVANQAQGFGNLAHALADRIGRGEADKDGAVDGTAVDHLLRQVAEVWGQVPFRTPWSSDREFAELRAGLARFVAWHSRADARELLATEQGFRSDCTLPNGEQVTLRGFADRLELDSAGRIVVVDLKTGKYPAEKVAEHAQLGLYQLAVASGAFDDLLAGAEPDPESGPDLHAREPGGAELWQLRLESVGSLKVQRQLPPVRDEEGWLPVERKLADAVEILRDESLVTRPGTHCSRCPFQRFCPAVTAKAVLG
ncbi:MAG: PD-(D/E)XK nuclease family protein, partial [Nocardioides sp.]